MRMALIRMRSDSPPFDDMKKGERHLRDFWGYYVFLYFGLYLDIFLWTCVFVFYGYVFLLLMDMCYLYEPVILFFYVSFTFPISMACVIGYICVLYIYAFI